MNVMSSSTFGTSRDGCQPSLAAQEESIIPIVYSGVDTGGIVVCRFGMVVVIANARQESRWRGIRITKA